MKTFLSGMIVLVMVVGFSSCQREVDGRLDDVVVDDNIYIDKFIELDTTYPSGLDTSYKYSFIYDGQKRLKQIAEIGFDDGTHNIQYIGNEYRYYNGSDTVPYKTTYDLDYTTGESYRDTSFLFYDGNNVIYKDSNVRYESGAPASMWLHTYSAGETNRFLIKRTSFDFITGLFTADSINSIRSIIANNIVSTSDSFYNQLGGLQYVVKYTFNYDNKLNPYNKIALHYPVYGFLINMSNYQNFPNFGSKNNPTTFTLMTWLAGSVSNDVGEARYEYDNNGYPKIIRYNSGSSANPQKDYIYYRTL